MGGYDQNMLYEIFEELIKVRIILCMRCVGTDKCLKMT